MKRIICLISLSFLLSILAVSHVAAEDNRISLAVSPGMREIILAPGESKTIEARVTNISNESLPVRAFVGRMLPLEDVPAQEQAIFNASTWFTIEQTDFILKPNEGHTSIIKITAPRNAEPGGHYATVYFQPLVQSQELDGHTAQVGARVGMIGLITVKGDAKEAASITSLSSPGVKQAGPVSFELDVKNQGAVHIMPSGYIEIYDMFDKPVDRVNLPMGLVLPKTEKTFQIEWDNKGRLGKFSAKAFLTYGTPSKEMHSASVVFWVAPWLQALLTTIVVLGGSLLMYKTYPRWGRVIRILTGRPDRPRLRKK